MNSKDHAVAASASITGTIVATALHHYRGLNCSRTFGSIFFGMNCILPTHKDAAGNLGRFMLHKTSSFTPEELEGFRAAAEAERLAMLELVWIPREDSPRLFRQGEQTTLRGTLLSLTDTRHVLYTRGSVPFYRTYPGMYVPSALPFRLVDVQSSAAEIATELLALSKMNWNATQLDGRVPITLRTADSIGRILKHLGPNERPAPRYAYYM